MVVVKAIIILVSVIVVTFIITLAEARFSRKNRAKDLLDGVNKLLRKEQKEGLSFEESMKLAGLPIVSLTYNKKAFNFIVDTGSNVSHINKELLDTNKVRAKSTNIKHVVQGIAGNNIQGNSVSIAFLYKGKKCSNAFVVSDLSEVLESIKEATGIEISGLLGTDFFSSQNCVIDFNSYTMY